MIENDSWLYYDTNFGTYYWCREDEAVSQVFDTAEEANKCKDDGSIKWGEK